LRELLGRGDLPTAIVCGNDVLALSILLECQRQRIDVPSQVSITGFGDIALAAEIDPGLTTVRSPRGEIGHLAAEYLLASIEGRDYGVPITIDVNLVVRGTTGAPRVR
jgi:LacI family transcriptional regulator